MRYKKSSLLVLGAALGAAAGVCAYADGGRELLLSGPVEQLDQGAGTVTVLGQKFQTATDQLTVGEVVNIYGQIARDGAVTDSLVQGTEKFGTNGDAIFLKGVVTGTDPALGRVEINGLTVDYTAELGSADFSMPAVGDVVAVAGTEPAMKGVLLASTTGSAAYAVGAPSSGMTGPAASASSGSKAASMMGMTGSGSAASMVGMTGSGSAASMMGMTGSGSAASMMGMTGSGGAAGVKGRGAKTASNDGMTGSGR